MECRDCEVNEVFAAQIPPELEEKYNQLRYLQEQSPESHVEISSLISEIDVLEYVFLHS